MVAAAVIGSAVVTGVASSQASKSAAKTAANAQTAASDASIAEQQRQFDAVQELMSPYVNAGTSSLTAQQNLLGLNGKAAQQSAINSINNSAQMQTMVQQGENAILQNASATGGLRGGNTQSALAQYRPQLLNQLINQQYSNLSGITSLGQNAAAMQGNAGMQTASNIGNYLTASGNATAASALASGQATANAYNSVNSAIGTLGGMYLYKNGF